MEEYELKDGDPPLPPLEYSTRGDWECSLPSKYGEMGDNRGEITNASSGLAKKLYLAMYPGAKSKNFVCAYCKHGMSIDEYKKRTSTGLVSDAKYCRVGELARECMEEHR